MGGPVPVFLGGVLCIIWAADRQAVLLGREIRARDKERDQPGEIEMQMEEL